MEQGDNFQEQKEFVTSLKKKTEIKSREKSPSLKFEALTRFVTARW